MKHATLMLIAAMLLAWPALGADDDRAEVPVTKIVLFSSGVGYFQHDGRVAGDTTTRLMFKADQINDVLKSMVLNDLDGGQVASVNYASHDPLGRALKSFAIDISGDPDLAALLKQLRLDGVGDHDHHGGGVEPGHRRGHQVGADGYDPEPQADRREALSRA